MPTTYTQNGGISKPGPGEQSGIWGTTANNDFDIIDRLINGVGTITLTGTSSTLTTSDGLLSDGQYAVLILAGSPSGTHTITIAPATAQKCYLVRNTTLQSVVFTQGSGSTVTLDAGLSAILFATGGGASAAVYNLANTLSMSFPRITGGTITGITDLAVPDGGTGVSTLTGIVKGNGASAFSAAVAGTDYLAPASIGVTVQAWDANLDQVAALSPTANNFIVGTGTAWALETPVQALVSLGVNALAADLNLLAGQAAAGLSGTELGYVNGVTSGIQPQLDAKVAKAGDALTGGFTATTDADGTFTTGTYTPTPVGGNFKSITNGGAFTLAAPTVSGDYTLVIQMTNNASAGAVTLTGFTKTSGDTILTTNTYKYFIYITKCNGLTSANVQALQ